MEYFEKYRQIFIAIGVAVVLVLVGLAVGGRDDSDSLAFATSTTVGTLESMTTSGQATSPTESPHNPDVAPIDCFAVLDQEAIDEALDVWDRPGGPASSFAISRGETCVETLEDDENSFVRLEPGSPEDFEPNASFLGSGPRSVTGVGDDAVWFEGAGQDAHAGLLAVRTATPLGILHLRLVLGRPELDDAERLDIVLDLARDTLPRFPGVEPPPPEVITFEEEPGAPETSLLGVLEARVESGEWTRGEGLVAILEWMSDGTTEVIEESLADPSATGVIAAAMSYVREGGDGAEEIGVLLDRLAPSLEELDEMSAPPVPSAASDLVVSAMPVAAQEDPADGCDYWGVDTPCLEKVTLPEESGIDTDKYSLYAAINENSQWSVEDVETAKKALVDSVITYEALESMPETALVLRPGGTALYASYLPGEDCRVYVDEFLAGTDQKELQQILAREIAFCFISYNFFLQFYENPNPTRWLVHGLANYLSGFVYTSINLEHQNLPTQLAQTELSTTVPERSWTNWILFEHFHSFIGAPGVVDLVGSLPESADLVTALADAAGVSEMYHDLGRALSDANVDDLGPGLVPYSPQAWELDLSGPAEVPLTVPRFGVRRLHIKVSPGEYACVTTYSQGGLRVSWRPGAPGDKNQPWSDEVPDPLEGESVLVVTSVEEGAHYTLDVEDVDDDPDCEDESDGPVDPEGCDLDEICDPSDFYWEIEF